MCSRFYLSLFVAFLCLALFSFPQKADAVSVTVLNAPSTITQDTFTVTATISGALTGTNYLRVDLYKDGTTNYFGDTFNKTSWYNGSDGTQYFPVTIPDDLPVTIQGRVGSPTTGEFDGTGNYKLRIRRYTKSGSSGSGDTIDSVSVNIIFPTPTPTPIPITQEPTSLPTNKPTPTTKPTSTSQVKSVLLTRTPTIEADAASTFGAVLGTMSANSFVTTIPTRVAGEADHRKTEIQLLPLLFILGGFLLLASCGILIFSKSEKGQELWKKFFPQKV